MVDITFKINGLFHLSNGLTALTGTMEKDVPYNIRQCACCLIVNGSLRQVLTIDGEMIAGGSYKNPDGIRSVSISGSEKISLDKDEIQTKECYLLIPALPPKTSEDNRPKYKKYIRTSESNK